jgi:hypothetical protein
MLHRLLMTCAAAVGDSAVFAAGVCADEADAADDSPAVKTHSRPMPAGVDSAGMNPSNSNRKGGSINEREGLVRSHRQDRRLCDRFVWNLVRRFRRAVTDRSNGVAWQ